MHRASRQVQSAAWSVIRPAVRSRTCRSRFGISRRVMSWERSTRENGRFLVPGLEAGGPYTVTARRIGFAPAGARERLRVADADDEGRFPADGPADAADWRRGRRDDERLLVDAYRCVDDRRDSTIARIPTLNRDFTDLVKLSPHVNSTVSGQGPSAAGTYNRFNNYTIDGANQNDRFNLAASTGVPGGCCRWSSDLDRRREGVPGSADRRRTFATATSPGCSSTQ